MRQDRCNFEIFLSPECVSHKSSKNADQTVNKSSLIIIFGAHCLESSSCCSDSRYLKICVIWSLRQHHSCHGISESFRVSTKDKILVMITQSQCNNLYIFRTLVKSAYQKTNFLISQPKHMLWVLKRTVSMRQIF